MAADDESTSPIEPQRRLAQVLLARFGFVPPVPVEEVLANLVDMEFADIPVPGTDAVLIDSFGLDRPRVVINNEKNMGRRRFTIAHEIGHVLIPWHSGFAQCHPNREPSLDEYQQYTAEREANDFASEFLMPEEWIREIVTSTDGLSEVFTTVRNHAGVSVRAACIALMRKGFPPGVCYVAVDSHNKVKHQGRSNGSAINHWFESDTNADLSGLIKVADEYDSVQVHNHCLHWFRFQCDDHEETEVGDRTSSEILTEILNECDLQEPATKVAQRINGIVASANGQYRTSSASELFQILRQRFLKRENDIVAVREHVLFEAYLRRRAWEFKNP